MEKPGPHTPPGDCKTAATLETPDGGATLRPSNSAPEGLPTRQDSRATQAAGARREWNTRLAHSEEPGLSLGTATGLSGQVGRELSSCEGSSICLRRHGEKMGPIAPQEPKPISGPGATHGLTPSVNQQR